MKTLTLKLAALTIFLSTVFIACKKDSRSAPLSTTVQNSAAVNQSLTQGFWRIGSFVDNSTDKTNNYTGFQLHFSNTGTVSATSASTVFTGSWSTNNSNNHLQLILDFTNEGAFTDLTHNWAVIQLNGTQLKFADTDNGNADYLTLNEDLIK